MESWFPARETLIPVESADRTKIVTSTGSPTTKDQHFLLHFIMGTYFGPHFKEEPHKSVFQRRAERLPPYTCDQLSGSHTRIVEIERIYYYILRKADPSVVVKLPLLHQFLLGNIQRCVGGAGATVPVQFGALFPPRLHPHSLFNDQYDILFNVVFINEPETYFIHPAVIKKFKELTCLEHLFLDRDRATTYTLVSGEILHDVPLQQTASSDCDIPCNQGIMSSICSSQIPSPTKRDMDYAEKGSAATLHTGPVLGLLDIGECDDCFLFHVSLPGVKRDAKTFSCEVESDGTVLIRGVTAGGESVVHRHSEASEMMSQNLCPPGPFSMSFKLPGPVDRHQFSGNFGTDGILEGLVMKARSSSY